MCSMAFFQDCRPLFVVGNTARLDKNSEECWGREGCNKRTRIPFPSAATDMRKTQLGGPSLLLSVSGSHFHRAFISLPPFKRYEAERKWLDSSLHHEGRNNLTHVYISWRLGSLISLRKNEKKKHACPRRLRL